MRSNHRCNRCETHRCKRCTHYPIPTMRKTGEEILLRLHVRKNVVCRFLTSAASHNTWYFQRIHWNVDVTNGAMITNKPHLRTGEVEKLGLLRWILPCDTQCAGYAWRGNSIPGRASHKDSQGCRTSLRTPLWANMINYGTNPHPQEITGCIISDVLLKCITTCKNAMRWIIS